MKRKFASRMLSMFLAGAMVFSNFAMVPPEALGATEYATPATEEELNDVARWFAATNGYEATGTFAKIINGVLYTWGSNARNATGLTGQTYTDASGNKVPVAAGTKVPVPTPIAAEAFNNEKVHAVVTGVSTWYVLTEGTGINGDTGNNVYNYGYTHSGTQVSPDWIIYQMDTSPIHNAGKYIVKLKTHGPAVYAQDSTGGWWSASNASSWALSMRESETDFVHGVFAPVSPTFIARAGGIKDISGMYAYATLAIGADGKIYAFGNYSKPAYPGVGILAAQAPEGQDNLTGICLNDAHAVLKDVRFVAANGEDWSTVAVSTDGDVWAFGGWDGKPNALRKFGLNYNQEAFDTTHKVFDHNVLQKKAVRAWVSSYRLVVLCDDNTVYAMGDNSNGVIIPGGADYIDHLTQILMDLSQEETIVGVFPTNDAQMAIVKSGDMLFGGNNASGGAGDGTTASKPAGTVAPVVSSSMPPSAPLTKNMVSYELEVKEDNKTVYYRPVVDGDGTRYTKVVGTETSTVEDITIDAGTNFKLNVYFDDFGKINTFVMPIRFNPAYLEVVNGSGKAYSRSSEVVTPGAVGASVGITQGFTVQQWRGGSLAIGTKDGTYPKISNADGWVSVAGYSADANPIIDGKVKMFSIDFRARTTVSNNGIAFDFATDQNIPETSEGLGYGYDATCNGVEHNNAYWSIYNSSGNGGESGYFTFETEPFPKFNSRLVVLTDLGMSLTYGANNTAVTDVLGSDDAYNPGWNINWSNPNVTYTLTADPYHRENGAKVAGASFPQVKWTFDTAQVTNANNLDRKWEDYITVVDTQDTYVQFKVNPNFVPNEDEDPGFIRVTATSQSYGTVKAVYYVSLRSYSAPNTLALAQKDTSGNLVQLTDGQEMVYHYKADASENRVFWVDFAGATNNTEVVWSLLDADGDPIDITDPSAKVTFAANNDGSVTIEPHYTTTGEEYVVLHVESLYDSSKYDEVKIKIQLYATNLGFSPDVVRMAVMKGGIPSTINLGQYLQVQPVDVYATNYTWAIVPNTITRDPANATEVDASFVPGTPVTYGSLGSGSTASTFTAFEYATPKATTNGGEGGAAQAEEFVVVRVTDTLSGKTADVKIAIMDLNSPIGIDQFAAVNNLGYHNDTVMVKSGLKLGDVIDFYPSYDDAVNGTNRYSSTTIVEGMYPYFTFVVGNKDGGVMKGEGGFMAVKLTRKEEGASEAFTYDPVPVSYSAEPSLVDGYVHLFGKNTGSVADKDIRIDLEGLNFKETVYTDASGYFKFTKYIAPGTYSMIVTKQNYLTRRMEPNSSGVGGINIQVNEDGEFHISTYNQPILLFPGELTNDNTINIQDINYYVANWVGQYDGNIADFDIYDFLEDNLITLKDLELLLMRKDWISGSYPVWAVPGQ